MKVKGQSEPGGDLRMMCRDPFGNRVFIYQIKLLYTYLLCLPFCSAATKFIFEWLFFVRGYLLWCCCCTLTWILVLSIFPEHKTHPHTACRGTHWWPASPWLYFFMTHYTDRIMKWLRRSRKEGPPSVSGCLADSMTLCIKYNEIMPATVYVEGSTNSKS